MVASDDVELSARTLTPKVLLAQRAVVVSSSVTLLVDGQ